MKNLPLVILAAGKSSRFYPFSHTNHKSLTTLMGKPILIHTLLSAQRAGFKEAIIVMAKDANIPQLVQQESDLKMNVKFVVQNEANGMGDALLKAEHILPEKFFVASAHRLDIGDHKKSMEKELKNSDCVLLAKKEDDVSEYGVLDLEEKRVKGIVEKPPKGKEPSNYRVLGVYIFSKDLLERLKNSTNHYSLEDELNNYVKDHVVTVVITENDSFSLKYPWDIFALKDYLFNSTKRHIARSAKVHKSAIIEGQVVIGDNTQIMENAVIKGPAYIGSNVIVGNNALIRNGSVIEDKGMLGANSEVKDSIFFPDAHMHSGFIASSVIGQGTRIGAKFVTANKRIDRKNIMTIVKGEKTDTHRSDLGIIMGDYAKLGIDCSSMPGVILGKNVTIGPSTSIQRNVDDNTIYYTKFEEIIEKKSPTE